MSKTTDRQIVNGETYELMDSAARTQIAALETSVGAQITALETSVGAQITALETSVGAKLTTLNNAIGHGPFQYINLETIKTDRYYRNDTQEGYSQGYATIAPFDIDAGTYYCINMNSNYCWLKKKSNNEIVQILTGMNVLESGTVYLSGNYVNYNPAYWIFTNMDVRSIAEGENISFPHGAMLKIMPQNIDDANFTFAPYQYMGGCEEGKYWSGAGQKNNSSNWYAYDPIYHVPAGVYYTTFMGGALSFCWLDPDDGSADIMLRPYSLEDSILEIPKTGTIYMSHIIPNAVLATFVPSSNEKGYSIGSVGEYKHVTDVGARTYLQKNNWTPSSGSVTVNGNVFTVNADDSGVNGGVFSSSSNRVRVEYNFNFSGQNTNCRMYIRRYKNGGGSDFVKIFEVTEPQDLSGTYEFDAASWNVYANAESYEAIIWGDTGAVITMNRLFVYEADTLIDSPYYAKTLDTMLLQMSNAIESASAEHDTDAEHIILRGQNGEKRGLLAGSDGSLYSFPYIPAKYLVFGNSITCGYIDPILGAFGMASTEYEKDWVYKVDSAIKQLNPNATYTRIYSSPFEHCETLAAAREWIEEIEPNFSDDIDLVLVEMGDNVNTEAKKAVFADSFPEFLQSIRVNCPKARIILIGIWFNSAVPRQIITSNCAKYGAEFVDISALHTAANEATAGDTIHYSDGTTGTISEGAATHPGDGGMDAIGSAVVTKLAME